MVVEGAVGRTAVGRGPGGAAPALAPGPRTPAAGPWGGPVVSEPRWRLFLDALFAVAFTLALLGVALQGMQSRVAASVGGGLVLAMAGGIWLAGLRHRSHPVLAWLLVGCAVVLIALSNGASALTFAFLAMAVLTVEVGPRRAAPVAVLIGPALSLLASVQYSHLPDATLLSIVLDGLFVSLSLGFAVIVGALLRDLEVTRGAALRVNEELATANERLRETMSLERDLVLAEERARSSRELHDGLSARLTVTSMSLDYALRMRERDPELAWAEVARAAEGNRETLGHMRTWVRALSPPQLTPGLGGAAAFEAIADSFRGTGLSIEVRHEGDEGPLPPEVTTLAYRVVQEGLTNALRYAGASAVVIALRQSPEDVRIAVRDDGPGTQAPVEGFGLRALREQAEGRGGQMVAGPRPEGGFELAVRVPLTGRGER